MLGVVLNVSTAETRRVTAVKSKVMGKPDVSTLEKAETLPARSRGRVELECERASDLLKNCWS